MLNTRIGKFVCALALVASSLAVAAQAQNVTPHSGATGAYSTHLHNNWSITSAEHLPSDGATISTVGYKPTGWIHAIVPTTVLAAQVAAGLLPDPTVGMNMRHLPGGDYPYGERFANLEMPQDSPYRAGWWYRTEFHLPSIAKGKTVWLHFSGINYRANIWVNGRLIADSAQIAGAYRIYDLNITSAIVAGNTAALAVEVFAPGPKDLGINWVDWNPAPPDKDMGIYGAVDLTVTGSVAVRAPFVKTHFPDASLNLADITVGAHLENGADHEVDGELSGTFSGTAFKQSVHLAAGESKDVSFSPQEFPQLHIHHPEVWWPGQMGKHPLIPLNISFIAFGAISDTATAQIGIREIGSEFDKAGVRRFLVNSKPILIRGAGWSQDLLMREDREKLPTQIAMIRDMHLNTIRLEGKLETEQFFHLTDLNGMLVMAGWCCCDQWEHWTEWTPETYRIAASSLRDQMLRLRSRPSIFVWLNGSDFHPPENVEQAYLDVEKETGWPNLTLSSASRATSTLTGPTGVKMTGPYDYVDPSYWLTDSKFGGAFGFNTETSPGPAVPLIGSLRQFLPPHDLWPVNDVWSYHTGTTDFANLNKFDKAMQQMYGMPSDLESYDRVSQTMAYEGERAMFEAFGRNKYAATGVIQWMLNNAWPSMIWHLYDYYLQPGGGYFGVKLACEPIHIQYSYDNHSIFVVNSTQTDLSDLLADVTVFGLDSRATFHQRVTVSSPADSSVQITVIPQEALTTGDSVHFVHLSLENLQKQSISRNFYWIPSQPTIFDWEKTDYTQTPAKQYADLQALNRLPRAQISARFHAADGIVFVDLANISKTVAFQLQITAVSQDSGNLLPLLWTDNYLSLTPGEHRQISASLPAGTAARDVRVQIGGWNIAPSDLTSSDNSEK